MRSFPGRGAQDPQRFVHAKLQRKPDRRGYSENPNLWVYIHCPKAGFPKQASQRAVLHLPMPQIDAHRAVTNVPRPLSEGQAD